MLSGIDLAAHAIGITRIANAPMIHFLTGLRSLETASEHRVRDLVKYLLQ